MKSIFKAVLWLCLLAAASNAFAQSGASKSAKTPGTIQMSQIAQISDFDESTWAQLLKSSPRPAAYLFTTSYCSSCPDAFEQLHKAVLHKAPAMPLTVVMMDVSGAQALRHALHQGRRWIVIQPVKSELAADKTGRGRMRGQSVQRLVELIQPTAFDRLA